MHDITYKHEPNIDVKNVNTFVILNPSDYDNRVSALESIALPLLDTVGKENIIYIKAKYIGSKAIVKDTIEPYVYSIIKLAQKLGIKNIIINDIKYWKYLTKLKKVLNSYGSPNPVILDNKIMPITCYGFTSMGRSALYDRDYIEKFKDIFTWINKDIGGNNVLPNITIEYVDIQCASKNCLDFLLDQPLVSCDIETRNLGLGNNRILSIGFATNSKKAYVFHNGDKRPIDNLPFVNFLQNFKGKLIFHNANFDVKILIYTFYLKYRLGDSKRLLQGISDFEGKIEDTKLMTYLVKNCVERADLSLKSNIYEYLGNYGEDVSDTEKLDLDTLLNYNGLDAVGTYYLYDKRVVELEEEDQVDIYNNIFIPSVMTLLVTELTGMPLDVERVLELDLEYNQKLNKLKSNLLESPLVCEFSEKYLPKNTQFNSGSSTQLSKFLFDFLNLKKLGLTKNKAPSTDQKTLIKLMKNTNDLESKKIIQNVMDIAELSIIQNTFIKAFLTKCHKHIDGRFYLHGNFNLGGTVTGRLSSNSPNLTNIPSKGNPYAKDVKSCFVAPKGYILMGADFSSLEDRVSALTTKDPNKLKVYTDNYDGHCLRAFSYFPDKLPNIINTKDSINSIKQQFPSIREKGKATNFTLTYGGTKYALMRDLNFSEKEAVEIINNHQKLYEVAENWVKEKVDNAYEIGYMIGAFGLKLRTKLLHNTLNTQFGNTFISEKNRRTAGNFLGQSYSLLNSRAANEFVSKTISDKKFGEILPICQIHDDQLYLVKNTKSNVHYFIHNLTRAMKWNKLNEIQHDEVKIFGEVDLYYPNWSKSIDMPEDIKENEIQNYIKQELMR